MFQYIKEKFRLKEEHLLKSRKVIKIKKYHSA